MLTQLNELSDTSYSQDQSKSAKHVALDLTFLRAILVELWSFEDRGWVGAPDAYPGSPNGVARQVVLAVSIVAVYGLGTLREVKSVPHSPQRSPLRRRFYHPPQAHLAVSATPILKR